MVGNLNDAAAESFGKALAPYFNRDDTLFVISTDFCHWGENFDYQPYDKAKGQIWQSIKNLDTQGMQYIEKNDYRGFTDYLDKTQNTICGREPIRLLLQTIKQSQISSPTIKFTCYDQSNKVENKSDMSVSYASAIIFT